MMSEHQEFGRKSLRKRIFQGVCGVSARCQSCIVVTSSGGEGDRGGGPKKIPTGVCGDVRVRGNRGWSISIRRRDGGNISIKFFCFSSHFFILFLFETKII